MFAQSKADLPDALRATVLDSARPRSVADLAAPERGLFHAILTAFASTGRPPDPATLARDQGRDPEAALRELVNRDLIALDPAGRLRAAYPFSPVATAHRVDLASGFRVYAMCAVDALGVPAMLGTDAVYTTTGPDPTDDRVITVTFTDGRATWRPETAVVLAGQRDGCDSAASVDTCCGLINAFPTPEAAHAWAEAHPGVTSHVLSPELALHAGTVTFGPLLRTAATGAPPNGDDASG